MYLHTVASPGHRGAVSHSVLRSSSTESVSLESNFCVQTLAPEEIDPGQHGLTGNLRLTDIEDSDAAEVTVSPSLLRKYKSNLDQYCGQLQEFCVRRGISQITVDTSTDMNVLLVDYLRRRGLLK